MICAEEGCNKETTRTTRGYCEEHRCNYGCERDEPLERPAKPKRHGLETERRFNGVGIAILILCVFWLICLLIII